MLQFAVRGYRSPGIDVESELEALGDDFGENVFVYWSEVAAGKESHWGLLPFDEYEGIPTYKYSWKGNFCLVAIEDLGEHGITAWLMLAAREKHDNLLGELVWDGYDYDLLRSRFLRPRIEDLFW